MGEAGFGGIRKSVTKRQNMVAQYIATQPILDLCERSTRRPGVRVYWRYWGQASINLKGGEEEGGRGSDIFGVGFELGIERGSGRRGGVEGSEWVEWSRVEWGGRVTLLE